MSDGMLTGIRVLDTSSLAPGAYATSQLAQLGAEVIKIERPHSGDPIRALSGEGETDPFVTMNAGKRSVVIDLKTSSGWDDLGRLIAESDVVVSNYTTSTAERLGLSYERVREFREDIILVSITGFAPTGAEADRPGHDLNFLAASGTLPFLQCGDPTGVPDFPVSDALGGTAAAFAVAAALVRRLRTGEGEHVRLSLTDSLIHARVSFGMESGQETAWSGGGRPGYGLYEARDGRWLAVGVEEPHFWDSFCVALGLDSLRDVNPMGTDLIALRARERVQRALRTRTAGEWEQYLGDLRLPVCQVHSAEEANQKSVAAGGFAVQQSWLEGARFLPRQPFLTERPQPTTVVAAPDLGEGNTTFLGDR